MNPSLNDLVNLTLTRRHASLLILLAGAYLLGAGTADAAETTPARVPLWAGQVPVGEGKFGAGEAFVSVYLPPQPNGASIVICPGGGYGGLVTGAEGVGIARWLNEHGIIGVVLEYRLPAGNRFVPLLDAQRALRFTRYHAREWGADPERVGIMGFSAGGHLAATALTHFSSGDDGASDPLDRLGSRPDFGILVYPVITMGEQTHRARDKTCWVQILHRS